MLFSSEQFQSSFAATVVEDFHILKRLLETVYKALCASLQLGQGPLLRNANQRLEELARQKSALRLDIEPVDMVQYSNQSINQSIRFVHLLVCDCGSTWSFVSVSIRIYD
jgi:hypothetical protein